MIVNGCRKECSGREKSMSTNEEKEAALDGGRAGNWGKPGASGPLISRERRPGTSGPIQDQGLMRNNGHMHGKYGSSEKYGPSERQGVCKANRLQGLEVCPHMGAGCTWRGTSKELSNHLATHVAAHLALVTAECRRQAEEIDRLRGKLEEASVGREVAIRNHHHHHHHHQKPSSSSS